MFRITREISSVTPDSILMIGNFKIANTTLLSFFILILFVILCFFAIRKFKMNGNKFQNFIEYLYESLVSLVEQITGSKKHAIIIFPLIGSLIFYIFVSNLISLIPGLTTITIGEKSLFRSPTSDFNTTFGLALGCIILLQAISIKEWGFWGHIGKYLKFKEVYLGFRKSIADGFMAIVDFFVGILDIVGEVARVVSLSLRLFGNMYAGEVLATLILGAFAFVIPITWSAMSILSGVIQSIVFGSLVASFYILSVKNEEV